MRAFTRMRTMAAGYTELKTKIEAMEEKYDEQFQVVFKVIKSLLTEKKEPRKPIGFRSSKKE